MTDRSNIYVHQGTDFVTPLDFYDDSGAIDITGYQFLSEIRKLYSTTVIGTFTITVIDAVGGNAQMSLPSSSTATMPPGKYKYDVLIKDADSNVLKILEGLIFIMETVTDSSGFN